MSSSDSDYSIDWLASDEDDYNSDPPEELSPGHRADTPVAPSSSSSPSLPEPLSSCSSCAAAAQRKRRRRRRRRSDCQDEDPDSPTPTVSPVQGFTSVCKQAIVGAEPDSNRKRSHSASESGLCEKPQTETENELFFHKCSDLQCYIQPLSSILQGLRSGRYSDRLSSFQESVAIDRIQRIMGVLQNPHLGGRFLNILLKIEEMLLSWFPHVKPNITPRENNTAAKKLKPHSSASPPPPSDVESSLTASHSSTCLKWLHMTPICSLKTPGSSLTRHPASTVSYAFAPPTRCSQKVTQDNAVSSTSDLHCGPRRQLHPAAPRLSRGPLPFKISSPCLERLLQAKESIISPRVAEDGGWTF
ncbi:circadian-associated transcriptional repressor-like isoform X4 [Xyrichtys novacula]|uniref:Circadian-associated transcriptional repressor-like isoform X4 n=1 Tax=Xyrichtys novacula TaxID=13765 RepID=A0AAV1EN71_XYRNO|nr:circadian-associated transcriptional repressor-like isoform X4 [Xyrichtys novacula]